MPLFNAEMEAVREQLYARVAVCGPTGSGKSWTALQWARILAGEDGPVGVVDTENRSAAYYAPKPGETPKRAHYYDPPYRFMHLAVKPGDYDPRDLGKWIDAAADDLAPNGPNNPTGKAGVLIIDSLSHYWEGEGGTLQIVDDAGRGNSYAGWKEGTPAQRYMVDKIIHAPFHVIVTMRSKMEYVLEDTINKQGKKVSSPRKVGMAPVQRAGIEYEFTVVADMDLEHAMTISKTRCDLLDGTVAHKGRSAEVAETFSEWLGSGATMRVTDSQAEGLVNAMNQVADMQARTALKKAFVERFGGPFDVTVDQLGEAQEWIATQLAAPAETPAEAPSLPEEEGPTMELTMDPAALAPEPAS